MIFISAESGLQIKKAASLMKQPFNKVRKSRKYNKISGFGYFTAFKA